MMELKVWVEGIQRIVCGVNEKTTCQDIVIALAHATGQTGRFSLVEKCRSSERSLPPSENPLRILSKWGHYASDIQFILRRSGDSPASSRPSSGKRKTQEKQILPEFSPDSGKKSYPVKKAMTFSGGVNSFVYKEKDFEEKIIEHPDTCYEDLVKLTNSQMEKLNRQDEDLEKLQVEIISLESFESLDSTLEDIEEEEERLESSFKKNETELSESEFWEDELELEQQNREMLRKEVESAKEKVKDIDNKLVQYGENIEKLTKEIGDVEQGNKDKEEKFQKEFEEKEKKLVEEQNQLQKELDLQIHIEDLNEKSIEELDETLNKLDQSLSEKKQKSEELDKELKEINLQDFEDTPIMPQTLVVKHGRCSTPIQDLISTHGAFTKFGSGRRFQGNPRILETAQPSTDNPEGIWV
ncbi:ras association domain-containing protein 8-like [Glandiceps talaboti]